MFTCIFFNVKATLCIATLCDFLYCILKNFVSVCLSKVTIVSGTHSKKKYCLVKYTISLCNIESGLCLGNLESHTLANA